MRIGFILTLLIGLVFVVGIAVATNSASHKLTNLLNTAV